RGSPAGARNRRSVGSPCRPQSRRTRRPAPATSHRRATCPGGGKNSGTSTQYRSRRALLHLLRGDQGADLLVHGNKILQIVKCGELQSFQNLLFRRPLGIRDNAGLLRGEVMDVDDVAFLGRLPLDETFVVWEARLELGQIIQNPAPVSAELD